MDVASEDQSTHEQGDSDMAPALADALIKAQAACSTVPTNGHNKNQGYKYATLNDVISTARKVLAEHGLGVSFDGWRDAQFAGQNAVASRYRVSGHGHHGPWREAVMPLGRNPDPGKGLAAAKSLLRKYALGDLLNMSWCDPSEDPDSDHFGGKGKGGGGNGGNRNGGQSNRQQQQRQPDKPRVPKLRSDAMGWQKFLVSRGFNGSSVTEFATGITEPVKPAPDSVLKAICLAGQVVKHLEADGGFPKTHDELIGFLDTTGREPLWSHGKITAAGESVDKSSQNAG